MIGTIAGTSGRRAYKAGIAIAVLASLLTVWTTIVRDDGNGMEYFMLVMAALVGAFSAWFRPAGMARTMIGVAIMQILLGIAIVTAPLTAAVPAGVFKASLFSAVFASLWLLAAAFFRAAMKGEH